MHTYEEQLAASSGSNSVLATERIKDEGISITLRSISGVLQ